MLEAAVTFIYRKWHSLATGLTSILTVTKGKIALHEFVATISHQENKLITDVVTHRYFNKIT
jgi:hypothetical protein